MDADANRRDDLTPRSVKFKTYALGRSRFPPARGLGNLADDEIVVLGERYNQGPVKSDETLAKDLSYGKRIVGRKEKLAKLLTDTPVSEPDWSAPLKNAVRRIGEDLDRAARDGFPFPGA